MNFTSAFSAETISRTLSVQIVQCIMRMPCISYINSFWVSVGYCAFNQSNPLGVRILDVDVLKKRLEMAMPLAEIASRKGPDGARTLGIDAAKQTPLDLIVYGCPEKRRVQIHLTKAAGCRTF